MSGDLEREIRSRLKRAELPDAPRALQARTAKVVATNPAASSHASELGRQGRLLLPLAAVLVIGATAILGTGTGPRPITSDVPGSPAGPAQARLSLDAAVFEWCSPGGCEFDVALDGPGGPWQGQLAYANLGERAPMMPSLPVMLAAGTYSLRSEIHVVGDAIYPGESGPRGLGTTATCISNFEVVPDTEVVAVTLGFWLDRCAAGTVTTADASRLAAFSSYSFIDGVCGGAGGCDYRFELSGPGGTWAAMPESVKPGSQLVINELVSMLPPGSYRLTASSHRMSEEPAPGSGHQTELGVAATCSTDFVITAETGNVSAHVLFVGEACSVEAEVQGFLPTSTPGIAGPVPTDPRSAAPRESDPHERSFGPEYPTERPAGQGVPTERMRLSGDRRTLTVEFWGGGCLSDYVPWVGLVGAELQFTIVAVPRPVPMPSGTACIMVAYRYTYHLALAEPFTGDTVRDLNGGVLIID